MLGENKSKAKLRAGGPVGVRVAGEGGIPQSEYCELANGETMVLAMIESVAAVENIEAIAAVDGIDVLNIGTSDLSQSMGRPGQKSDPELLAMVDRVITAALKAGKGVSVGGGSATDWPTWRAKGQNWFG